MIIQQESTSWDSTKMCATCLSWLQCRYIGVKKAHLTALTTQDSLYAEGTDHRVWVSLELREPGMQGACFCPKCLSMPRVMTPITLVFWVWGPWFWIGAFLYLGFMDYDDYGPTAFWWLKQDKVMVHQLLRGVDKSGAMSTRLHVPVSLWWKNMKRSNCCCMFARHGRLGLGNHRNDDSLCFFCSFISSFHFEKGTLLERESCELRLYPIAVLSLTTLMSTIAIKPVVHPTSDLPKYWYVKRYILMMSASPYEDLSMSCHLRQSLRFNEWTTTLNEGSKTPDSVTEMLDVIQTYLWSTRARIEAEWLGAKLHRRLDIPMCKVHGDPSDGTLNNQPHIHLIWWVLGTVRTYYIPF